MIQGHKNISKKMSDSQGYSLIEVLIAMAVFAIGILAIFSMQITSTQSNALARGVTENYTCAGDKVEELMALPYDDDLLRAGVHPDDFNDFTQATDGIDNNGDGQVDEAGESGYINLQYEVWENRVWDRDVKSIRVIISSTVNGRKQKTISFDVLKADM